LNHHGSHFGPRRVAMLTSPEITDGRGFPDEVGDAVAEFASRWNLDPQATEYLNSLDDSVKFTILAEFAPRDNTHDVAGKMYAFARSIISQQSKNNNMTPELEAFAVRWSLDGAAVAWLLGLPPEVSSILIEQFDPKEDTHNIIGKMRSFARSIQARIPTMGTSTAEVGYLEALGMRLSDFAAKWGLEDSALGLLRKLPPAVQSTVIEQFDPKGETVNVNGKLCAFARSIAAGRQVQGVVESFALHWGLDAGTTQFLKGLPQDVRAIVIQQFDPMAGTRDVCGRLRMFAKGILAKGPHSERHFSEVEVQRHEVAADVGESAAFAASAAEVQAAAAAASDPAIADFVVRWGLDASCVSLLESLPQSARLTVLEEFDPRGNTRNVSAKLRAFANTVVTGQGRSSFHASMSNGAGAAVSTLSTPPMVHEEEAFLEKWGLAGNHTAVDVLRRLHPPVRARVMREFAPGHDTHDIFGKFCGFSASVAKAAAKEGASGLPPLKAPSLHLAIASQGSHLPAASRAAPTISAWPRPAAGGMTPQQFADKWQLDPGSRALLSGLDPEAQATVILEFQPRGETRDTSGKFCAFARSVAARLQSTRGQKRGLSAGQMSGPLPVRPRI